VDNGPDSAAPVLAGPGNGARALAFIRRHALFLAVLVLAVGLRVAVLVAYKYAFFFPDSRRYVDWSMVRKPDQFRPAGYSFFLKPFVPGPLDRVAVLQHLLGLALVVAGYVFLTRRGVRRWVAALAVTPIAIDGLELDLEHFISSETLFVVLLGAALFVLTWRQKLPAASAAVVGLLLAAAAVTRTVGQPLIILVGCYLIGLVLAKRTRWYALVAFVAAAGLPLAGYMTWYHHFHGVYGFDQMGGRALYSRVMTIADCDKLDLTDRQRLLCVPEPPAQRPENPDYWGWNPNSPGNKYFRSVTNDPFLRQFGMTVIKQQPGDYLRMVVKETSWYFRPEAPLSKATLCRFGGWELPERPDTTCHAAYYRDVANPKLAPKPVAQPSSPLRAALADYSVVTSAIRGPMLGVVLLAALVPLVWRPRRRGWRDGADALLFAAAGSGLLLLSVAVGMYEPRYAATSLFLLPIGAALASRRLGQARPAVTVDQDSVRDRSGVNGAGEPDAARHPIDDDLTNMDTVSRTLR
jgi:hypothetical protein